jgi:hypothetical protein
LADRAKPIVLQLEGDVKFLQKKTAGLCLPKSADSIRKQWEATLKWNKFLAAQLFS